MNKLLAIAQAETGEVHCPSNPAGETADWEWAA